MRRRTTGALLAVVLTISACGGSAGNTTATAATRPGQGLEPGVVPTTLSQAYWYDELHTAAEYMEEWALLLTAAFDEYDDLPGDPHTKAARLVTTFDFLLRDHVVTTAFMGQAMTTGSDELVLAAEDAMGRVRQALHQQFLHEFDREIASAFDDVWLDLQLAYVAYADAVRGAGDPAAALAEIGDALDGFVAFMVDVTGQKVEREELTDALDEQATLLTETLRLQEDGDPAWLTQWRAAVDQAKRVAELVANGIAAQLQPDGDTTARAVKLRAELSGRMAETPWFVAVATHALAREDQAVFEEARALVDANTAELREVFSRVLGETAGSLFADLWDTHNDLLVEFAEVAADAPVEEAELEQIEDRLAHIAEQLGVLFERATDGAISARKVESLAERQYHAMFEVIEAQTTATE